jgi:hypothetical protein
MVPRIDELTIEEWRAIAVRHENETIPRMGSVINQQATEISRLNIELEGLSPVRAAATPGAGE